MRAWQRARFTFALDDPAGSAAGLRRARPDGGAAIEPGFAAWEELAGNVAREPSLTPFPAETLRERWEQGHAAVLLDHAAAGPRFSPTPASSPSSARPGTRALAPRWASTGRGFRKSTSTSR